MLLLSHLEHLMSAAQLGQEIQMTRAAILRNTDYVDTVPVSKYPQSTPDAYLHGLILAFVLPLTSCPE